MSATLVLLALFVSHQTANASLVRLNSFQPSRIASSCLDEKQISNELDKLSFTEFYADRVKIVDLLMRDARKSLECRKTIILAIVKAMDKPDLDLERDRSSFHLWLYGSEILANLKATEALDFLIAHLDLHDGTVFPLTHHPAMVVVVGMGKIAIPYLAGALRKSRDAYLRRHIVFCLGWLGGRLARKTIEQALTLETDACTAKFMRKTVAALNNKKQPNHITSSDRLKWYASFRCDVQ